MLHEARLRFGEGVITSAEYVDRQTDVRPRVYRARRTAWSCRRLAHAFSPLSDSGSVDEISHIARYGVTLGVLSAAAMLTLACSKKGDADAYGTFEATEVVVASQTTGQIERFVPVEECAFNAVRSWQ